MKAPAAARPLGVATATLLLSLLILLGGGGEFYAGVQRCMAALSLEDRQAALDKHNSLRVVTANEQGASDMLQMVGIYPK